MMLTIDEARKKGIQTCIDVLGRELVEKHKATSTASWGMLQGAVRCFVGVDTRKRAGHMLVLDSTSKWYKCAECKVSLKTGDVYDVKAWTEGQAETPADVSNRMPEGVL